MITPTPPAKPLPPTPPAVAEVTATDTGKHTAPALPDPKTNSTGINASGKAVQSPANLNHSPAVPPAQNLAVPAVTSQQTTNSPATYPAAESVTKTGTQTQFAELPPSSTGLNLSAYVVFILILAIILIAVYFGKQKRQKQENPDLIELKTVKPKSKFDINA